MCAQAPLRNDWMEAVELKSVMTEDGFNSPQRGKLSALMSCAVLSHRRVVEGCVTA